MPKIKLTLIIISLILLSLFMASCSKEKEEELGVKDNSSIIDEQNKNNIQQMAVMNNAISDWDSVITVKKENYQTVFSLEIQNILLNNKQKAVLFNNLYLMDVYIENNKTFAFLESADDNPNLIFVLEINPSLEKELLNDACDEYSIITRLGDIKRKAIMNINTLPIDEHEADFYIDSTNTLIIYGELIDIYKY